MALPAHAALVEQVIEVPVRVANAYGRVVEQPIVVSVYQDSTSPVPRPIALINHGRAADAAQRAAFGRATAIAVAAKGAPGVLAAINFAGGGGGNPLTQPQQP